MNKPNFEPLEAWALAHTRPASAHPCVTGIVDYTRSDVIRQIERDVCGNGNWHKWAKQTGAKVIKVTIVEGWGHD